MALKQGFVALAAMLAVSATPLLAGATAVAPTAPVTQNTPDRLVLLGTAGGPAIRSHRAQIGNLVESGGKYYVVDCGEGCVTQLKKAGVEATQVDALFLTHLHLDHVAGVSSLGAFAWAGGKGARIAVHGPPGTAALVKQGLAQFAGAEAIFGAEVPGMGSMADVMAATEHEVSGSEPVEIFRDANFRVTAVENSHFAHLAGQSFAFGQARSYALRFDTPTRSIVFTGDTGSSPAVVRLAKGADILVSEVMDVAGTMAMFRTRRGLNEEQAAAVEVQMRSKHLTPEDVGNLAKAAGVKMVVLSHDGSAGDEAGNAALERMAEQASRVFGGPVVASLDLQVF